MGNYSKKHKLFVGLIANYYFQIHCKVDNNKCKSRNIYIKLIENVSNTITNKQWYFPLYLESSPKRIVIITS